MLVTEIEKQGKYKYKVYIDQEFVFWLSYKELYFWKISEGIELTEEKYRKIMKESILEKCKRKAISYLKFSDRTENELRRKLKQQMYVDEIIDATIQYLQGYHYIDDDRYIENYIGSKKNTQSKKWIMLKLQQKGINSDKSLPYFDELYSEEEPVRRMVEKKLKGTRLSGREEKEKVLAYLYRKGFSVGLAVKILREYE